jgi:hypothetical protein
MALDIHILQHLRWENAKLHREESTAAAVEDHLFHVWYNERITPSRWEPIDIMYQSSDPLTQADDF